jgi:hypothetical protein
MGRGVLERRCEFVGNVIGSLHSFTNEYNFLLVKSFLTIINVSSIHTTCTSTSSPSSSAFRTWHFHYRFTYIITCIFHVHIFFHTVVDVITCELYFVPIPRLITILIFKCATELLAALCSSLISVSQPTPSPFGSFANDLSMSILVHRCGDCRDAAARWMGSYILCLFGIRSEELLEELAALAQYGLKVSLLKGAGAGIGDASSLKLCESVSDSDFFLERRRRRSLSWCW